jgi:hypothetical protein
MGCCVHRVCMSFQRCGFPHTCLVTTWVCRVGKCVVCLFAVVGCVCQPHCVLILRHAMYLVCCARRKLCTHVHCTRPQLFFGANVWDWDWVDGSAAGLCLGALRTSHGHDLMSCGSHPPSNATPVSVCPAATQACCHALAWLCATTCRAASVLLALSCV